MAGTVVVPGRLFVGSFAESFDRGFLERHGVTHILNVASELEVSERVDREYLKLGVNDDDERDDISRVLDAAVAFATRAADARVMVHCLEGVSRSVVVAACCAAAMRPGSDFATELAAIRAARPEADPFPAFVAQAERWDSLRRRSRCASPQPRDADPCSLHEVAEARAIHVAPATGSLAADEHDVLASLQRVPPPRTASRTV